MTGFPPYVHGFSFSERVGEAVAVTPDQVLPTLRNLERQVAGGLHAAGFIAYEAASGLNPDLTTPPSSSLPLLRFELFRTRTPAPPPDLRGEFRAERFAPTVDEAGYLAAVERIRELIEAGDCYQVNFTMAERFGFSGDPAAFFAELVRRQPTPFASYLEAGRYRILSVSPELFFSLEDGKLTTRPMKGTARRGRWSAEDLEAKAALAKSAKERAENLMIVDLLRNDLGMVSKTGSVAVPALFEVETYPTVHQMTSTVTSTLREGAGITEVLAALFPCGSVTGAPKRRSMEIVAQLEREARGVYTGGIGYLSPDGSAQFSVAIRTLVIDAETGTGVMGIGSGITHGSQGSAEHAECLAKGRFARNECPELHLIESLLHDGEYFLLERHLKRLEQSAAYFAFPFSRSETLRILEREARTLEGPHKVRLLLTPDGALRSQSAPIPESKEPVPVAISRTATDPADPFLYHKTSHRALYQRELSLRPDCAEVLFANRTGMITEGSYSNVVARIAGKLVTPPVSCGLLPGVFREELLMRGEIEEGVLTERDLRGTQELYVINSVRRWRRARLAD